jgi:nuclear GTP-binding protein
VQEYKKNESERSLKIKQRRIDLARAKANAAKPEEVVGIPQTPQSVNQGTYYREFHKVLEKADVILQVLDARDPMGTRAKHVEDAILSGYQGKKIIMLLNKVDLVPKENVQQWLAYLRHEFPVIAFKATTQSQRKNLGQGSVNIEHASDAMLKSSECLGADSLVKLLKNYCRSHDIKTSITVGIIGYPNVGKSSVINSLKRAKVCNVGSTPGLTRVLQEINLDKNIKLLDCPGIVFSPESNSGDWKEKASVTLRNCLRVEALEDPITPVELILSRSSKPTIMLLYNIPTFSSTEEFLFLVAKMRGKLKKGGVPDIEDAARTILMDWNQGKIPFYSVPPKRELGGAATIVANFASELDLDADLEKLQTKKDLGMDYMEIDSMVPISSSAPFVINGALQDDAMEGLDDEETVDKMETPETEYVVHAPSHKKALKSTVTPKKQDLISKEEEALNPQLNQIRRKAAKQTKKLKSKLDAKNVEKALSSVHANEDMEVSTTNTDAYDFGEFAWGGAQ